jgi:hypothetical protein
MNMKRHASAAARKAGTHKSGLTVCSNCINTRLTAAGHAHKREDSENDFPTKVRMTVVQVSAGSNYDPSLVPNLPPAPDGEAKPKVSATGGAETTIATAEACACRDDSED